MCCGWSLISVFVSSLLCGLSYTCSAREDVVIFLSLTARWCSFSLCPRVLSVWPMYV